MISISRSFLSFYLESFSVIFTYVSFCGDRHVNEMTSSFSFDLQFYIGSAGLDLFVRLNWHNAVASSFFVRRYCCSSCLSVTSML